MRYLRHRRASQTLRYESKTEAFARPFLAKTEMLTDHDDADGSKTIRRESGNEEERQATITDRNIESTLHSIAKVHFYNKRLAISDSKYCDQSYCVS